jgi:hypothetical protein
MQTRESIESMLAWLVPIAVVSFLLGTIGFTIMGSGYADSLADGFGVPGGVLKVWIKFIQSLMFGAINFVVAVWLYRQAHATWGRRLLWAAFGFTSGVLAVCVWLLVRLQEGPQAADRA